MWNAPDLRYLKECILHFEPEDRLNLLGPVFKGWEGTGIDETPTEEEDRIYLNPKYPCSLLHFIWFRLIPYLKKFLVEKNTKKKEKEKEPSEFQKKIYKPSFLHLDFKEKILEIVELLKKKPTRVKKEEEKKALEARLKSEGYTPAQIQIVMDEQIFLKDQNEASHGSLEARKTPLKIETKNLETNDQSAEQEAIKEEYEFPSVSNK